MAPDGGQTGEEVSTVITCEGTLGHPEFPRQFQKVVDRLNGLLGVPVKVRKLEPWNSVRVTLSVPREAALRLRQLAQQGASQLRALGILSVQLDGEGAISLRLQGANGEPQEVVLRTTQDGPSTSSNSLPLGLGALLPTASGAPGSSAASSQVQFKSPNVVCPPDSVVPRVGANMTSSQSALAPNPLNKPPYAGPFPFASMNQAIHSQSNNNNNNGQPSAPRSTNMDPPPPFLPPPYPGVRQPSSASSQTSSQPAVTISSPLLVNLLQNDHQTGTTSVANSSTPSMVPDLPPPVTSSIVRQMRPPPPPSPAKATGLLPPPSPSPTISSTPQAQSIKTTASHPPPSGTPNHLTSQANVLVNSSNNNISNSNVSNSSSVSPPSALSTSIASNTSPLMATNSPVMTTNHTQLTNSSLVTSTQMAINSIANSLASAAKSMTTSGNNPLGQQGLFGISKSGFAHPGGAGNQPSVQHYQRTPQGSIIAVNKPLPVPNQTLGTPIQSTIPLNQTQRSNVPLIQTQNAQAILRQQQQQITSIPQKTTPMFAQNNAISHQNNVLHSNQVKILPGNQNNMMTVNQNTMVPGSNVTLPGNNHVLPHAGGVTPSNPRGLPSGNMGVSRLGQQQQQQHQSQHGLGISLGVNVGGLGQQQLHSNAGLGLNSTDALNTQVTPQLPQTNLNKSLPSPPPYSVAISRSWDSLVNNTSNLLDLAPSLTDLKPDDLDDILPTLGHDPLPELSELELLGGPSLTGTTESTSLSEDNGNSNSNGSSSVGAIATGEANEENSTNSEGTDGRKFLINPLTGELEPHSGGESDTEEVKDVFTGLPSPLGLSDEDTNSTIRPDTATDQSDSETRSSNDGKHSRVKNSKVRREGRDSPALKPTEKIKLRLKLEKSEPINPAYKVDVSFINTQQPKKASTSVITPTTPSTNEELRVPPLHISLRGRNSVVIKNKTKLNPDGTPVVKKVRKLQSKGKKEGVSDEEGNREGGEGMNEHRKMKKFKGNHEHKDLLATLSDNPASPSNNAISKYSLHNHYKEKQKERRGSDSDLVRSNSRKHDANGALVGEEKRRRLSQSEGEKRIEDEGVPSVLGSTNVGTVGVLPQKIRKDKIKIKDSFKIKDNSNRKLYSATKTNLTSNVPLPSDKVQQKPAVMLPTATDVDMEAKFKQSLMEEVIGEKGIPRPPHRTVEQVVHMVESARVGIGNVGDKISKAPLDLSQKSDLQKEKSPDPDKCNVPDKDRKSIESLQERDKQLNAVVTSGGRSPNSGSSGGQGEDSGIESMDALSEKSPNQASQSPHADILPNVVPTSKTQVPDMLDIEAQLAKMEGLDNHEASSDPKNHQNTNSNLTAKKVESVQKLDRSPNRTVEDVNENECIHRNDSKSCCDLTCTLQDGLSKGSVKRTQSKEIEEDIVPLNTTKKEDQQPPNSPPALRVAPALYTYPSDPVDKGGGGPNSRGGSESPSLTTEDEYSNLEPSMGQTHVNNKGKSLLEQLLIEIPSEHHGSAVTPSSHSPATRSSVRTRALSKLDSPELSSHVSKTTKTAPPVATAKRKRNESDSSNHSVEEARKRPRKGSGKEASEVGKKVGHPINLGSKKGIKGGNNAPNQAEESSDSDEPLIEKLRKNPPKSNTKMTKGVTTPATPLVTSASQINNKTNIRRSARAGHQQQEKQHDKQQEKQQQPAQNTRSREKVVQQHSQQQQQQQQQQVAHSNAEAEAALRRKTRSAGESKKGRADSRAPTRALVVLLRPLGRRR